MPAGAPSVRAGSLVGPYRLLRVLAEGGMGAVWLAQRSDGLIDRLVALKLPQGAWERAGLSERLARERQILATLDHPNIARLYDAGLASEGQPFLALEYVDGPPIDEYCRARRLDLRARVRWLASRVSRDQTTVVATPAPAVPELDDDGLFRVGDKWVALPPVEHRLARALLDRLGAVVTREALARAGWPTGSPGRNALDVHVLRLRRRLAPLRMTIHTVRSRGYLLAQGDPGNGA